MAEEGFLSPKLHPSYTLERSGCHLTEKGKHVWKGDYSGALAHKFNLAPDSGKHGLRHVHHLRQNSHHLPQDHGTNGVHEQRPQSIVICGTGARRMK